MKERLDVILVNQGHAPSREKAKAIIMSGNVYVNGQKEDKAGSQFDESKIQLEVRGSQLKYVSRGGLKLERPWKAGESVWREVSVWILVLLPEDLLIVCCKMVQ